VEAAHSAAVEAVAVAVGIGEWDPGGLPVIAAEDAALQEAAPGGDQ
jgi:hypothetical protein